MSMLLNSATRMKRRNRSPEYDFHVRHQPHVIQPFMYAPVRPGETLKSVLWQSRCVTDPLANPLMGWHIEYYYFYVQLQDAVTVGAEDTWLAPLWNPSATFPGSGWGTEPLRQDNGDMESSFADMTYRVYARIIEEYFREEGEVWNSTHKMHNNLALARRSRKDMWESSGAQYGVAPDVTLNIADGLTYQEIVDAMTDYAMLIDTSMGAVTTFEDYLASQGQGSFHDVKRAYRPELIRVVKEWSYPTNTVDPTSGTPTSAVSWSIAGRADKDRYFKQPGYVVGITVARPKTLRTDPGHRANVFTTGEDWLPVQSMDNPAAGRGSYTRDLFEYGYQFVNWDPFVGTYKANQVNWVGVTGVANVDGVYPVLSSFDTNVWKAAANNKVRQDGKVQLNILTDLPPDMNVGATDAPDLVMSDAQSVQELATEYQVKLNEAKSGKVVNLPNVRAMLEKLVKA